MINKNLNFKINLSIKDKLKELRLPNKISEELKKGDLNFMNSMIMN